MYMHGIVGYEFILDGNHSYYSGTSVNIGLKTYHLKIHCDSTELMSDDLDASGNIDIPDIILALQIMSGIQPVDYFLADDNAVVRMENVLRMLHNFQLYGGTK